MATYTLELPIPDGITPEDIQNLFTDAARSQGWQPTIPDGSAPSGQLANPQTAQNFMIARFIRQTSENAVYQRSQDELAAATQRIREELGSKMNSWADLVQQSK